ncbi:unnamed protein product [Amoebophrya sp. A25]|nr:unnamed protein product [Amoebophrya sp. A25]|eukprot:GSA25T00010633001.1
MLNAFMQYAPTPDHKTAAFSLKIVTHQSLAVKTRDLFCR